MARKSTVWYWKSRKLWYTTINGEKVNLGPDKREAEKEFHRLLGDTRQTSAGESVATILDDFLAYCYENRAKRTSDRYRDFLQDFVHAHGRLKASELHAGHVTKWLNGKKTWGSTTKRNAITAVSRAFNWATKNRGLDRNPVRGMEKPEAKRRTTILTAEEFATILDHVSDQPFRDLLIVSYDSGARPQEVKRLEARHVDLGKQRALIPAEEAKGGIPRAIYFPTDRSIEVVRRLTQQRPEGPLFLNNRGNPWTGFAVKNRMEDLEEAVGKRFRHYDFRRTFITRNILAGVDSHVVATLSGHKSTAMIDRHYSAVASDHAFLLEQAKKGANT